MADFIDEIVNLNEENVVNILKERLANNEDPLKIMDDVKIAMKKIGDLFSSNEYFLPDLMMAGEILRQIFELIGPKLKESKTEVKKKGKILLGTVKDDIHDIGKDIVRFLLESNGYDVLDLGVDVPPEKFVEKIKEYNPDIVALSGFLTIAFDSMKETIEKIKEAGLRDNIKIMIGGGTIDESIVNYVGADSFGDSAVEAVNIADKWMEGKK
ncbi:MAG: cobalamin B12-binding domain-containing protein [Candidatus Helarchaeota archaeon]